MPPDSEDQDFHTAQRIVVVGTSGSGKTTLARNLARHMGVPHVELDALHWGPNWTEIPDDLLRERTTAALRGDAWVVDGNYSAVRDIVWGRAEAVVWLDYALLTILWQLLKRTLRRVISREELWHGNRERLSTALFSRDSIFLWALQTYRKRRREYPVLLSASEYRHIASARLRSPRAMHRWLAEWRKKHPRA